MPRPGFVPALEWKDLDKAGAALSIAAVTGVPKTVEKRSRASCAVISPALASSPQLRPRPAARAIHSTVCRSRSPPGLSLTFGSRT